MNTARIGYLVSSIMNHCAVLWVHKRICVLSTQMPKHLLRHSIEKVGRAQRSCGKEKIINLFTSDTAQTWISGCYYEVTGRLFDLQERP